MKKIVLIVSLLFTSSFACNGYECGCSNETCGLEKKLSQEKVFEDNSKCGLNQINCENGCGGEHKGINMECSLNTEVNEKGN